MTDIAIPAAGSARVHLLPQGYAGLYGAGDLLLRGATMLSSGPWGPFRPGAHA